MRGTESADCKPKHRWQPLTHHRQIAVGLRSAQKSARRRWHKGADRRRGGRGLVERLLNAADQSLLRRMKAKTAGKINSRRQPTKQAKSAPWKDRHPAGQERAFPVKKCRKKSFFVIKKSVFEIFRKTKTKLNRSKSPSVAPKRKQTENL